MATILVTGGAGFIGSHAVLDLTDAGYNVVVLDNLSGGHQDALLGLPLEIVDILDSKALERVFSLHKIDAVIHFAAFIEAGISVKDPLSFYHNNVSGTINLLRAMQHHNVKCMVFSSTAAVYGNPEFQPITEESPSAPINPYGSTKTQVERILVDCEQSWGLKSIKLRYFNAAGADPQGRLGERHDPETHLIPLVLQAAAGRRSEIVIFGEDYPTPDGTCIRDYIHVSDLVSAHRIAVDKLLAGGESGVYNLGVGKGFSVKEVVETAIQITGCSIPIKKGERREGDPPILVADSSRAQSQLQWKPIYPDLNEIIEHAWNYFLKIWPKN